MAERAYFLDSTEDDEHLYQAADWARFHHQIIGNGVSNDKDLPNLKVSATTNMQVSIGAGFMFGNGHMYELTKTMSLKHDIADSDNDRIDRIIIKFDTNPESRDFYAYIKKGIAGANPSPPPVERSTYVHEMSVAQVRIKAGSSVIDDSQITDERTNDAVCGYIPLHNIYRGLQINELGVASFPNQSFIKTRNNGKQIIEAEKEYGKEGILNFGTTEVDKQREIYSSNKIKVKSSGVYSFWVQVAFYTNKVKEGAKFDVYLYVNGKESFPLGSHVFSGGRDRFVMFSGFDELEEGDVVEFKYTSLDFKEDTETYFTRIRVAKTA